MKHPAKKWCFLLAAVLAVALGISLLGGPGRNRALRSFEQNRPAFEAAARQVRETGDTKEIACPPGVRSLDYWDDDTPTVEFLMGSWGLGSQTCYWGVNYVEADKMVGFQGQRWEYWKEDGAGRMFYEVEGDNHCYIQRLAPCWYYFEMYF